MAGITKCLVLKMKIFSTKSHSRDKLFDLVRLEMLGPIETDNTELRQQSLIQKPTDLFSCGIIFPKDTLGTLKKRRSASELGIGTR